MTPRYVRTLEQVRRLQKLYAEPEFKQFRSITALYETDPEVIAAVLPPPLTPTERPLVSVSVSHIGMSNGLQPFGAAGLAVECSYEGLVGTYPLTMPMSTDSAVIFGRELYGEPKKVAEIQVVKSGDQVKGTVERYGVTYIELFGTVTEEMEPGDSGESSGSTSSSCRRRTATASITIRCWYGCGTRGIRGSCSGWRARSCCGRRRTIR